MIARLKSEKLVTSKERLPWHELITLYSLLIQPHCGVMKP